MERQNKIHEQWRKLLKEAPWVAVEFLPVNRNDPFPPLDEAKKKRKACLCLEKALRNICKQFNFQPPRSSCVADSSEHIGPSQELEPNRFSNSVGKALSELIQKVERDRKQTEKLIHSYEKPNAELKKRSGERPAVPLFLAEIVLAGLKLQRRSKPGLDLMRKYFAMGGTFHTVVVKRYPNEANWPERDKVIAVLCEKKGEASYYNSENSLWSKQVRQTLGRNVKLNGESKKRIEDMVKRINDEVG